MISPLSVDKKTVEEFKIPAECELHPRQKLAFLESQLHEFKSMQWRSRMDIIHATRLTESENEVLRNKGLQNLSTHKNEVQQFTGGIVMLQKMIDELRAEHPNVGEVSGAEHPEG